MNGTLVNLRKHTLTKDFSVKVYAYVPSAASKKFGISFNIMVSKRIVSIILIYFENKVWYKYRRKIDFNFIYT